MKCAICGNIVSENVQECSHCYPKIQGEDLEHVYYKISILLKKAKGWVLVGFAIFPGWICHPLAFWLTTKAMIVFRKNKLQDSHLLNRIQRLRYIAGILAVLYWVVTFGWIINGLLH